MMVRRWVVFEEEARGRGVHDFFDADPRMPTIFADAARGCSH
jgi:hypothetical protein